MTSFGPFRLDAANQRVYRGSAETQLSHKATAILEVLTRHPNEVVTHDELLDSVWQGVHVQPEVLKVYIAEIRRALRDSADNPRYIQTAHRRGYRFVIPTKEAHEKVPNTAERLIGRSSEMSALNKLIRKAASGQRQTVFITGQSGTGKTTLLGRFMHRIQTQPGVHAVWGQVAHSRGETEPFSPILDALSELLEAENSEPIVAAFRQSAPGWLLQFPSFLEAREIAQLARDLEGSTSQRMIREFGDALDRCSRHSLIVLDLDDLHRADRSTLDLLEYIASSRNSAKLLIISAVDTGAESHGVRSLINTLQTRGLCEEIRLEPFSEESVGQFLDVRYPRSQVGSVLAKRLHRLSGGIPLFLCSAVQYMETQRWILKTGDGWISTVEAVRLEELIPPVLKDLIELKVRQLPADDQLILEVASIVGTEFLSYVVADALEKPVVTVEEACNRLVRAGGWLASAGFAAIQGRLVSPRFRFLHVVAREVLYCRQSEGQRVARHRRVAESLEGALGQCSHGSASELALHFVAGHASFKSIEYLRAAAARATRRYAGVEAAALLTEATKLTARLPRSAKIATELEVLDELGTAYFTCGDFDLCARAWHEAASTAMRHGRIGAAMQAMARLAFPVGWEKPALLRSAADRAMTHVASIDDPGTRAEVAFRALALRDIGGGGLNATEYANAIDAFEQISREGDRVRIASARVQYAWFELRSSAYDSAITDLEESLPVVLQHEPMDVIRAEWALGWALLHVGQWGRMQSVAAAASTHAQKNGSRRIEALFKIQLAWLHVECGAYQLAQTLCRKALELSGNPVSGVGVAMCHVIMAMSAIGLNDVDAALECAERGLKADAQAETFWRFLAEICILEAHLLKHTIPEIEGSARRVLHLSRGLREQTWKAVALSSCAKAAAHTGHERLAHQYSDMALQLVHRAKLPLAKWRVESAAASVAADSPRDAGRSNDAAQLRDESKRSRQALFNSLGLQDTLRDFARAIS
jgi:DNA-binding winged helix-turn-helix (wHTH) protein/tetratricopeptide (TPR) repeat protein